MLEVDHVRKEFGSICAVRNVSLKVNDGGTFGLLGPNGAGKTTTMRMILGVLTPDAGSVRWNATRVTGALRGHFGYLPEERGLYAKMKVREQIAFFAKLRGMRDPNVQPAVSRWIERLELGPYADRMCSELSKGNQQKVQMACAAVHAPQLIVLDEPFSGLDPVNAEVVLSVLRELKANGTALVLSSHQMWQLEELCEEFTIIAAGENRVSGTLQQLRAQWPTRIVNVAPSSSELQQILASVPDAHPMTMSNGELHYRVPARTDFAALLRSLVSSANVTKFEAIEPSLHEIYLRAIGDTQA